MAATCSKLLDIWGSPPTIQLKGVLPVPSDLSTCAYLYMTGADYKNMVDLMNAQAAAAVVVPPPLLPYDYATGGAFWAFGFTGVLILYFSSHVIGLVLKAVRRF